MKMMAISFFLFLVIASISAGTELTMFSSPVSDTINMTGSAGDLTGQVSNSSSFVNSTLALPDYSDSSMYWWMDIWSTIGVLGASLTLFFRVVVHVVTIGFWMQQIFPWIPATFAALFTLGADLVMIIGAVQFFRGISTKVMD